MAESRDGNTMLNVRLPDAWIEAIDRKARELEASTGIKMNRTDVARMALARFVGLLDPPAESQNTHVGA